MDAPKDDSIAYIVGVFKKGISVETLPFVKEVRPLSMWRKLCLLLGACAAFALVVGLAALLFPGMGN